MGGHKAVEKVVQRIKKNPFVAADGKVAPLSIAAGVALVSAGQSLDDIIAETDRFVYAAATRGGDMVVSNALEPGDGFMKRVMLLIKDAVTTRVLSQLLEKERFELVTFADWREPAANALAQHRFHLVIVDELLPPTGGIEVIKELRALPRYNRLPIAMLIATNAETSVANALEQGANDYITRPFSPFTFTSRIRRLLSRGESSRRPSGGAFSVLIVDSDIKTLMLAATALHQRGEFDIYLAKDSQDAVERMHDLDPEAILIDPTMVTAEGESILHHLNQQNLLGDTSIVVAQFPLAEGEPPAAHPVAVHGAIKKPFNPVKLGPELEGILGVSPNPKRAGERITHLNSELQRVMKLATPGR